MTSSFVDDFKRVDGPIGGNYTIPCGGVAIFDESVEPVNLEEVQSGNSPILSGTTEEKTQVLYTEESLDGPDQLIGVVWSHNPLVAGGGGLTGIPAITENDPSFTVLARMSKDPLLVDLGMDEQPFCYDQGYGLRVTFPRSGADPILKFVKYTTKSIPTGYTPGSSAEPDGALVLKSVTLDRDNLNLDADWDGTGNLPYQGNVQEMRLRVRRSEDQVILEAYLNDRNMNTPVLEHTDRRHPLWGVVGYPGFEFLSAVLTSQPGGVSPYNLQAVALVKCHRFFAQTVKDFRRPVFATPQNQFTYDRVTDRVITLVEKNGDARYSATEAGQTKRQTYLQFVTEAEKDIIRKCGFWHWLFRTGNVYLENARAEYELPEDCGLIEVVRPGNWNSVPLNELTDFQFHQRLGAVMQSGGQPTTFTVIGESVNNRKRIRVFPIPAITESVDGTPDPFLSVDYYARPIYPSEPDIQVPYVPQEHIDVLIYGAAAHALLLDTDPNNTQAITQVFQGKMSDLLRDQFRKTSTRRTIMQSAADVFQSYPSLRTPLLRSTQLETLLT